MTAQYQCRSCKLEWIGPPGITDCLRCRRPYCLSVTWTNFEVWEEWAKGVGIRPVATARPWTWPEKAVKLGDEGWQSFLARLKKTNAEETTK